MMHEGQCCGGRFSIVVPTYMVNGGLDIKFQSEPREVVGLAEFSDKISYSDFRHSIEQINSTVKRASNAKHETNNRFSNSTPKYYMTIS